MNYCPETVVVQSAFLLAERRLKPRSLVEISDNELPQVVKIVQLAVHEILTGLTYKTNQQHYGLPGIIKVEKRSWERKLHMWFYLSWLRGLGVLCSEDDIIEGLPPLPEFNSLFYLELITCLGWKNLIKEALSDLPTTKTQSVILKEAVKFCVTKSDWELFKVCLHSFLVNNQQGDEHNIAALTSENIKILHDGLEHLRENIPHPSDQLEVFISVVNLLLCNVLDCLPLEKCHNIQVIQIQDGGSTSRRFVVQGRDEEKPKNKDQFYNKVCLIHELESMESFVDSLIDNTLSPNCYDANCDHDETSETLGSKSHPAPQFSAEVVQLVSLLCSLLCNEWNEAFTALFSQEQLDEDIKEQSQRHCLHGWFVGFSGVLTWLIQDSEQRVLEDCVLQLNKSLNLYIEKLCRPIEKAWLESISKNVVNNLPKEILLLDESLSTGDSQINLEITEPDFDDTVKRLELHLEGYEQCFEQLLTTEQLFLHPDWLTSLQKHAMEISTSRHVALMIDILSLHYYGLKQGQELDASYSGLKQIILQVFCSLPIHSQTEIRQYSADVSSSILNDPLSESLFFHPGSPHNDQQEFDRQLVLVFNQLVDGTDEMRFWKTFHHISKAALICPYLLVHKAVCEAVTNSGQTKTICQMLQKLSDVTSTRIDNSDGMSFLVHVLREAACHVESRQQETNLSNIINDLLQGYTFKNQFGILVQRPPLLSEQSFTSTCVLPFLHHGKRTLESVPTLLALQLLLLTLNSENDAETHWINNTQPFTIIYLLCELLDDCTVLAHNGSLNEEQTSTLLEGANTMLEETDNMLKEADTKQEGDDDRLVGAEGELEEDTNESYLVNATSAVEKELLPQNLEETRYLVLIALNKILEVMCSYIGDNFPKFALSIKWLYNHVQELDWTVCLYLDRMWISTGVKQNFPLFIPTSLAQKCVLPDSGWTLFDDPTYDDGNIWTGFLECCRVSAEIQEVLLNALDLTRFSDEETSYIVESLTSSLAEVLPKSTKEEWTLILKTCKELIHREIIKIDIQEQSDLFIEEQSISDENVLSCLLVKVFSVLDKSHWSYMMRYYVVAIKEFLLASLSEKDVTLLYTVFGHVCQIIASAPCEQAEFLSVLGLDLLNQIKSNPQLDQPDSDIIRRLETCIQALPPSLHQRTMLSKIHQ